MKTKIIASAISGLLLTGCVSTQTKPVEAQKVIYNSGDVFALVVPAKGKAISVDNYFSDLKGKSKSWAGWSKNYETKYYGSWKFGVFQDSCPKN